MIHYARILLVGIGLLKILGFSMERTGLLVEQQWLENAGSVLVKVGSVPVVSPLPIVFTEHKGVETFAFEFHLAYRDSEGMQEEVRITPSLYGQFDAPYNYRNVIGAAISYGPILQKENLPLLNSVLHYSFASPGEISSSMGLRTPLQEASIKLRSKTRDQNKTWELVILPRPDDE